MNRIRILLQAGWLFSVVIPLKITAQQKPNIVLIVADDLGYGDLGCYGQTRIKTPNLDRLAARGIRFTRFYAGTSVCAPSRSSLMTGQHTGHTPIRGNYEIEPEGQWPLPDSSFTMAEMFRQAGYATGCFGKWGLGYIGSSGDPLKQGFDQFFGYNCQRQAHNYFPDHLWDNDHLVNLSNTNTVQQDYAPDLIQQKVLEFLSGHRSQPFFLLLTYTLPHAGLQLPHHDERLDQYRRQFHEQPVKIPAVWDGRGYQPQAYPHAAYAAMASRLDDYVGQVIKKLEFLGISENTLIIFTSDNGPHREGGNDPGFFNSSGGLRGIKRDLYEGGIREPMIACWPSVIRRHKTDSRPTAFWDFFPTFAAIAGQPVPSCTDGVSFLPTLESRGNQVKAPYLYWEFHEDGGSQAVLLGDWKGIRLSVMQDREGPIRLFNLRRDPVEQNDMASENRNIVDSISRIMQEAHVENNHFPFIKP
jgi:arylsulfatase A-like enzyme